MGSSRWSENTYKDRVSYRSATNTPTFTYDNDIKTGKAEAKTHDKLDPKKIKMRESRDSAEHPESLAIGVLFDVTGSMGRIPRVLQSKLGSLMNLLIVKGYVEHPQILFGAVGDVYSDRSPLQVGQFESGIEMEDDLTQIFIEGGGGGTQHESYDFAHYWFAHHTSIDCFEKRGKKGYLFTIGDEMPYLTLDKHHIKNVIGDDVPANLDLPSVIRELEQRYHVFHIMVPAGSNFTSETEPTWRKLLNERVLRLDDHETIAELIALTIGLNEGTTDVDTGIDHLVSVGVDRKTATALGKELVPVASAGALAKASPISGLPDLGGGGVTRL